ncbi:hypothetical protein HMPREF9309_01178 [Campylobacter ureolyticus ACS-301-V-Sch3b]|uniref:Uncharacterized protein n=1 Tax=Campylobacter ureolyticus ACS-301-V-Sch3b TaxID=883165 RepID=S3XRC0_9BACT|nr:hypothetical protein [Campylobacter ureolyticus]EPH07923.1 hypothetical protein HMPREF9309_01178 [Campylobacter ureolyticus ACS-301-V-Sch3b]
MKKITLLMILPFFLFAHSPSVLEYLAGGFGVANHKKKDGKLDSLSAMVILQRYFDSLK